MKKVYNQNFRKRLTLTVLVLFGSISTMLLPILVNTPLYSESL